MLVIIKKLIDSLKKSLNNLINSPKLRIAEGFRNGQKIKEFTADKYVKDFTQIINKISR